MKARILAYHRVSDEAAQGLETWSVRPAVFQRQMTLLDKLGYRGVPVRELLAALDSGASTEKLVGISFDDGYLDTVEAALPILNQVGFTASVYVVPEAIGSETSWEAEGTSSPLADWEDLRKLVEAGWEIGMHSRSHPARFDLLTGAQLEREIVTGVDCIEEALDTTVDTFAYPHGHFSDQALEVLKAAGYRAALTRDAGSVTADTHRFKLPRYEIKRRDTLIEFAFLLFTGIALRRRSTFFRFGPANLRTPAPPTTPDPSPAIPSLVEDHTKTAA